STGTRGEFSFPALQTGCRYVVTPGPATIGDLRVSFTPAQRRHFLPCNSCNIGIGLNRALTAPEQADDTSNQQHVNEPPFIADFIANVTGQVLLVFNGTTSGLGNMPMMLARIPPYALGDIDRNAISNPINGAFGFTNLALGGHYRLVVNNSPATNYEFTYS